MKVLCRRVRIKRSNLGHQRAACAAAAQNCLLTPNPRHTPCVLRPGSRGITDVALMSKVGPRPNCSIKPATDPEVMKLYAEADKILTF